MAKILEELVLPKEYIESAKRVMAFPLDKAPEIISDAVMAINSGGYLRGGLLALGLGVMAGRHFRTRPLESLKVMALAELLTNHAVDRAAVPVDGLGRVARFRPLEQCCPDPKAWIAEKTKELVRRGYKPKAALTIVCAAAKKNLASLGRAAKLTRTAKLVKMLES